jgi:cell division protease FtsH
MPYTLLQLVAGTAPVTASPDAQVAASSGSMDPTTVLLLLGSIALIAAIFWFISSRGKRSGSGRSGGLPGSNIGMQFNRGGGGEFEPVDVGTTTFNDVAGVDEAIKKMKRVKRWITEGAVFNSLGGKPPQGILLVGPPGTGKTLLAKALAGETGAILFVVPGSYFVEMFVGRGAARVRELVAAAKRAREETGKFVIIFIDEFDALGKKRSSGGPGGHDERDQTLNQLLVEMNGFTAADGILFMAATNRKDILDEAVLRPGRFTYHIFVDTPDKPGRIAILKVHMRGKPTEPGIPMEKILDHLATRTPRFSGADLAEVCNEGAVQAGERVDAIKTKLIAEQIAELKSQGADDKVMAEALAKFRKEQLPELLKPHMHIKLKELDEAIDILQMGDARESRVKAMTDEELWNTSIHEAGHYVIGQDRGDFGSSKATIMPRGNALGWVQSLSENDKFTTSDRELETRILQAFGGRLAQEKFLNVRDTGASNDFMQLNRIIRLMVIQFGMSEKLGEISINEEEMQYGGSKYGPALLNDIDQECGAMRRSFKAGAKAIIDNRGDALLRVAILLRKEETVLSDRLKEAFDNTLPPETYAGVKLPASLDAAAVARATAPASASVATTTAPAQEPPVAPQGDADAPKSGE